MDWITVVWVLIIVANVLTIAFNIDAIRNTKRIEEEIKKNEEYIDSLFRNDRKKP